MNNIKKLLAVILSFSFVLFLSGCNKKTGGQDSSHMGKTNENSQIKSVFFVFSAATEEYEQTRNLREKDGDLREKDGEGLVYTATTSIGYDRPTLVREYAAESDAIPKLEQIFTAEMAKKLSKERENSYATSMGEISVELTDGSVYNIPILPQDMQAEDQTILNIMSTLDRNIHYNDDNLINSYIKWDSIGLSAPYPTGIDAAYYILDSENEISEKIEKGMKFMEEKEGENIFDEDCYVFRLGTDHDENFVRESYYAVAKNLTFLCKLNPMSGDWEMIFSY